MIEQMKGISLEDQLVLLTQDELSDLIDQFNLCVRLKKTKEEIQEAARRSCRRLADQEIDDLARA